MAGEEITWNELDEITERIDSYEVLNHNKDTETTYRISITNFLSGLGEPFIGEVRIFLGTVEPDGWKFFGQALSRSVYADLFAVIGTTWGDGDGSTTFDLPPADIFPLAAGGIYSLGAIGGEPSHELIISELPDEDISIPFYKAAAIGNYLGSSATGSPGSIDVPLGGSGVAHNNMPPYGAFHFMVFTGVFS
jgi:hypothetical protein